MTAVATRSTGIRLLADLEAAGALTDTGLTLTRELPWEQYEALACMLGSVHRRSAWALADLLLYGEKVYGETYAQAAEATGLSEQSLMNLCSVANRVPKQRRRPQLSLSHHETVAKLEPDQQNEWLEKAVNERWTRAQLREAMRETTSENGVRVLPPAVTVCDCCGQTL